MRATKRYGLAGNMEDAHYVMYAADAARRAGLLHAEPGDRGWMGQGASANGQAASARKGRSTTVDTNTPIAGISAQRGGLQSGKDDDAAGEEVNRGVKKRQPICWYASSLSFP